MSAAFLFLIITSQFQLENSSDRKNRAIGCTGYDNTSLGSRCMNKLSVARIDSHMAGIAYNITRLCILKPVYSRTYASVCRRRMR